MSNFELVHFADPSSLADAAAGQWLEQLLAANRPYHVALAGGRIAGQFFFAVCTRAKKKNVSFDGTHFFWSDERCVWPNDPESNFAMAWDHLLAPLAIPQSQIHRVRGELPPEEAARKAEMELRGIAQAGPDSQPILDLIFLGMGEEGHVASLFPGERDDVLSSKAVYRAVSATKPPPLRITFGYPAIAAARQVWVLASGGGKAGALRESLAPEGRTPLARVLKLRQNTRILTDIQVD